MKQKHFSHIYLEEGVNNSEIAQSILAKFKDSVQIPIRHYKEVFNRPKQDWGRQKESIKLILANKTGKFLYQGPDIAPNFSGYRFRYTTPMINCLYDCEYCFLQGMFPSSNIVLFVNQTDFFHSIKEDINSNGPLYLCNSYETDLMAFEGISPITKMWIEFASKTENLLLEIRTKSANFQSIKGLVPSDKIILAWTLSPKEIAQTIESKTPSLDARLAAVKEALDSGWQVRICIDPLIKVESWKEVYHEFINRICSQIDPSQLYDIYLGSFRVNKEYLKKMRNIKPNSTLLNTEFAVQDNIVSYDQKTDQMLKEYVYKKLIEAAPEGKVYLI